MAYPIIPIHGRAIDITGKKFNRLTVLHPTKRVKPNGKSIGTVLYWLCVCDCGNFTSVASELIRTGKTKSCGCFRDEKIGNLNRSHSMTDTAEYGTWCKLKARCNNKNDKGYPIYGGRGIKVCDRWLNSFENFLADMGKRPEDKTSIDRINNDGNYCPENTRWSTHREQANNTSKNVFIEYGGKRLTLAQWSRRFGVNTSTIQQRLNCGMSVHDAFTKRIVHGETLTYRGETLTFAQWADRLDMHVNTFKNRIKRGWDIEDAFTRPVAYK